MRQGSLLALIGLLILGGGCNKKVPDVENMGTLTASGLEEGEDIAIGAPELTLDIFCENAHGFSNLQKCQQSLWANCIPKTFDNPTDAQKPYVCYLGVGNSQKCLSPKSTWETTSWKPWCIKNKTAETVSLQKTRNVECKKSYPQCVCASAAPIKLEACVVSLKNRRDTKCPAEVANNFENLATCP